MNEADLVKIAQDLGIDFSESDSTVEQHHKLIVFIGIVWQNPLDGLGYTHLHTHKIEAGDAPPVIQQHFSQYHEARKEKENRKRKC